MDEKSPVDAALFAFRKRDKRFVLTGATAAYIVGAIVIGAVFLAAAWPPLASLMNWYFETMRAVTAHREPSEPPLALIAGIAPWYGLYTLVVLIWYAAFEAACLRWLVRGETGGVLGISFGADTWRVLAVYLVWMVLGLLFCIALGVLYGVLFGLGVAAPSALRILMMLLGALAPLAIAAFAIYVGTRLSPAAAASVAQRKFAFFAAWGATRGRFWEMLGAFVILIAVYVGVSFVLSLLIRWPMDQAMVPVMQGALTDMSFDDIVKRTREIFTSPLAATMIALYALASVVLVSVLRVAWFGVNASIVAAPPQAPATPVVAPAT